MSDFCTCSQQKTLDLEDEEKKDYEDEEEVLPPTDDTEKAEEELEEEEAVDEPEEEEELLEEGKGYQRKDVAKLTNLLKQVLSSLNKDELPMEEEEEEPMEEEEKEELPMEEPMLDEEEEVSMSIKQALKTLQKSGMTVYSGAKKTPAARRVSATTPVQINWNDFSKSLKDIDNMAERAGGN